eukprot:3251445-Pleurochrysis_carterae.AAC.8
MPVASNSVDVQHSEGDGVRKCSRGVDRLRTRPHVLPPQSAIVDAARPRRSAPTYLTTAARRQRRAPQPQA